MAFLKAEIGKPLVLAIDDVTTEQGKFGPQTVFHAGDDSFAMAPESAKKQLDFIGVSDPTGLVFEFSKVDIGKGRTAINIKQVNQPTSGPKKAQPFDQPAHTAQPSRQDAPRPTNQFEVYEQITNYVLTRVVPMYVTAGFDVDAQAAASMTATLYIQANKH